MIQFQDTQGNNINLLFSFYFNKFPFFRGNKFKCLLLIADKILQQVILRMDTTKVQTRHLKIEDEAGSNI